MGRLDGQVAIITGASRGIGRAVALEFAREGARVGICSASDNLALVMVAAEIGEMYGDCTAMMADVTSRIEVERLVQDIIDRWGRIDVLVNNAGILRLGPLESISEERWDETLGVHLKGTFNCTQAVLPNMKQQRKGKIINISSGTVLGGSPLFLHYVSSKAAVIGFTRALAREVGGDNICVNSIMPGLTISGSNQEGVMTPEQLADRRKRRAIQRDQYPADLVGTVIFLSSDDSDFMTGQAIAVDGGMNMY